MRLNRRRGYRLSRTKNKYVRRCMKMARCKLNMSQGKLAQLVGCDIRFVKSVENGDQDASEYMWEAFEDVLCMPRDELRVLYRNADYDGD